MYIGGAQKRPDGNYSRPVLDPKGEVIGQVADGNRKDIRDSVEAAHKAAPGYRTFDVKVETILRALKELFFNKVLFCYYIHVTLNTTYHSMHFPLPFH